MSGLFKFNKSNQLIKFCQTLLNASLMILSLILSYLLCGELYYITRDVISENENVHNILGKVLVFFLYFGFISMIVKYFSENYHFPLRYLLYIGITATIRFIIVNNGNSKQTFWLSLVVLVLMISYVLSTPRIR